MVQVFLQFGVVGCGVVDVQLGYQFIDGVVGFDVNMVFFDVVVVVQGGGVFIFGVGIDMIYLVFFI